MNCRASLLGIAAVLLAVTAERALADSGDHCNKKVCFGQSCQPAQNGPNTHCLPASGGCAWDTCDAT